MMLRRISLSEKLSRLSEFVKAIKKLQRNIDRGKFLTDSIIRKAIERYLQLALESSFDIADHLISDYGFRKPQDYKESILILGEQGVLPKKFSEDFSYAAGFRNILVHDYVKLDQQKVYEHFKKDAGDIEKFMRYIVRYVEKK